MLIATKDRLSTLLALSCTPVALVARPPESLAPDRFSYQVPLNTPDLAERLMRSGVTRQVLRRAAPAGTYTDLAAFDEPMRSSDGARATVALYRTFLLRELPSIVAGRFRAARIRVPTRLVVGGKARSFGV
jgi:hypothetical protein